MSEYPTAQAIAGQTGLLDHPSANGATLTPLGMIRLAPRFHRVTITEGEYEGVWAEMWLNPPLSVMKQTQDRATFAQGMGKLIRAWNVADEDGQPIPAGEAGIEATPDELHIALIQAWQEARDFPKTSKSNSGPPI